MASQSWRWAESGRLAGQEGAQESLGRELSTARIQGRVQVDKPRRRHFAAFSACLQRTELGDMYMSARLAAGCLRPTAHARTDAGLRPTLCSCSALPR